MMFAHARQEEKRTPVPIDEIDRTPELYRLFVAEKLSGRVANILIGVGMVRTIGLACRRGRKWMLALPGFGAAALREVESLAAELGLEVTP
jgi:hypothetical protein